MKRKVDKLRIVVVISLLFFLFSSGNVQACILSHSSSSSMGAVVLLTGFEPFDNYDVNPSELIVEQLNGTMMENVTIISVVVPVDFNASVNQTIHLIELYHPVLVLSIGLSPKATAIEVEKCGLNLKREQREDGTFSFPRRIDPTGHFLYFSPLPVWDIVRNIRKNDIPVHMSLYAGMYVCNALFYGELTYITNHDLPTKTGFIHVPLLTSQDPQGMTLETMVKAVQITIQTSILEKQ